APICLGGQYQYRADPCRIHALEHRAKGLVGAGGHRGTFHDHFEQGVHLATLRGLEGVARLQPLAREVEQHAQSALGVLAPYRAALSQFVEIGPRETPAEDIAGGTKARFDRASGGERADREGLADKDLGNRRLAVGTRADGFDDALPDDEAGFRRLGPGLEYGLAVSEICQ